MEKKRCKAINPIKLSELYSYFQIQINNFIFKIIFYNWLITTLSILLEIFYSCNIYCLTNFDLAQIFCYLQNSDVEFIILGNFNSKKILTFFSI
jgi:hypothetical protein